MLTKVLTVLGVVGMVLVLVLAWAAFMHMAGSFITR
jgi:hypothetical protein